MELTYTATVKADWVDNTVDGRPCSDLWLGQWTGETEERDGRYRWRARFGVAVPFASGKAGSMDAAKAAAEAAIRQHAEKEN